MSSDAFRTAPVDETSRSRLADRGLDYRLVDVASDDYARWLQAVARGFLGSEHTDEQIAAIRERSGYRRTTGVYDASGPMADLPVASIASWIAGLTVPGGSSIPSCAISAVTVAPTHRRRGVARAMLEGELRAAAAAGVPMAMLTVSESTLYGRYGFAPAAAAATWKIETKRAGWIGPRPGGRIDFVPREAARELLEQVHPRTRDRYAGEIELDPAWWDGFAGTRPDSENPGARRAIRYADVDGVARGVAVYRVRENDEDFTKSTVTVSYLVAETDDAYAALWRFLLELDLIGEVNAILQSVAEPLLWMIADQRAATVTVTDHQYVRILDVPVALEARTFGASGVLALDVTDSLGFAQGRWLLTVDAAGSGSVVPLDGAAPAGAVEVALGVEELSAVYLGGVSLATLAAAGRVTSTDVAAASRVFGWHVPPRLSIWY
ncbi:GNAT family N-acetyltransferase [Microbacterium aoyamense]|uniref:GNAT family N-acetyltransferase n=1 Tax=Microbacterium aoyamense TaxID=344166 RepID=A0ABN2Q0W0_9MICO|nr:GNAT family N-acetyltransferase [Microbacterium aoyamense]